MADLSDTELVLLYLVQRQEGAVLWEHIGEVRSLRYLDVWAHLESLIAMQLVFIDGSTGHTRYMATSHGVLLGKRILSDG